MLNNERLLRSAIALQNKLALLAFPLEEIQATLERSMSVSWNWNDHFNIYNSSRTYRKKHLGIINAVDVKKCNFVHSPFVITANSLYFNGQHFFEQVFSYSKGQAAVCFCPARRMGEQVQRSGDSKIMQCINIKISKQKSREKALKIKRSLYYAPHYQ
jgi:hypothetical protein